MAKTIAAPEFGHTTTQGARLPGWPELNCERLARAMKCSPMHLRGVLAGRLGTTLHYIERISQFTEIPAGDLVTRIIKARDADQLREEKADDMWKARQLRRKAKGLDVLNPRGIKAGQKEEQNAD